MKLLISFFALSFLVVSCEKEEKPVSLLPKSSEAKLMEVVMGEKYGNQVFLNLGTGQTTTVDNFCWDLSFDASPNGFAIYQNSGKDILIANTGQTDFKAYTEMPKMPFKWDAASGKYDSIALKNCFKVDGLAFEHVFVLNKGAGKESFQFKLVHVTNTEYVLAFSNMENSFTKRVVIGKDHSKSMVYFSFDNGGTYFNFEPPKTDWHLCFLRYRWIYYEFNPPLRYIVSGVFINNALVSTAVDSALAFADLHKINASSMPFHSRRDIIGFDWKSPDLGNLANVKYTVRSYLNFVVKENNPTQRMFKLRFLDFYSRSGVKGTPQLEVQELN